MRLLLRRRRGLLSGRRRLSSLWRLLDAFLLFELFGWGELSSEGYRRLGGLRAEATPLAIAPPPTLDLKNPMILPGVYSARTYLKHYGLIDNPKRGAWTLTERGRATEQVDPKTVSTFVQELIKQGKVDNEKPADEVTGQTGLDIAQRLAQWRQEATGPAHPNYYHADLDQPVAIYATVSQLLQKLRASPDEFGRDDVVALFGVQRENYTYRPQHNRLTLLGYKGHFRHSAEYAVDLIRQGKLNLAHLVSHKLPLEQYNDGIELLEQQKAIKICFLPWEN